MLYSFFSNTSHFEYNSNNLNYDLYSENYILANILGNYSNNIIRKFIFISLIVSIHLI